MELRKAAIKNKQSLEKLEEKLDELEEHFRKTENLHKKDFIYSMSVVSSWKSVLGCWFDSFLDFHLKFAMFIPLKWVFYVTC